jgi:hypothetical protein
MLLGGAGATKIRKIIFYLTVFVDLSLMQWFIFVAA